MKEIDLIAKMYVVGSMNSLSDTQERALCSAAKESIHHAYAPYSNYKVGAAVLVENGEIVSGSNQENAVYPLGLCAERVALFSCAHQFPKLSIQAIAIQTIKELHQDQIPGFPCGSCRQTMIEMEERHGHPIKVFVMGSDDKVYFVQSAKDLMPFAFDRSILMG